MQQVTVRVPASTSNLGPGFDCLGVALRIYNEITISRGRGDPSGKMVNSAADSFFKRAAVKPFAFVCNITGEIPHRAVSGAARPFALALCTD